MNIIITSRRRSQWLGGMQVVHTAIYQRPNTKKSQNKKNSEMEKMGEKIETFVRNKHSKKKNEKMKE